MLQNATCNLSGIEGYKIWLYRSYPLDDQLQAINYATVKQEFISQLRLYIISSLMP
jgi:hypothetical protein